MTTTHADHRALREAERALRRPFDPAVEAAALELVNRARAELLLDPLPDLPGPRFAGVWDNTLTIGARHGLARRPGFNPEANAWAELTDAGLLLHFDGAPEDDAGALVPHTEDSARYAWQLLAWSQRVAPTLPPRHRGRRAGAAVRAREARRLAA